MKKLITTGIATAIAAFSLNVQAESSPFTYVKYAVGEIDVTNGDNLDYSAFSASLELPIIPILSLELIDWENFDITRIGVGTSFDLGAGHLYGLIHFNDYDGDVDSDFSLTAGFNTKLTERLEFDLSYSSYTDQDFLDSIDVSLGYYITKNFSIAGNYEDLENTNIVSVSAKLSF